MAPAEHANVIAIDPGYDRVGIAIFSKDKLEHSECFSPVSKNFTERLLETKKRIEELTTKFSPHACALETLFFSKNTKTALKVAEARGAMLLTAKELGLALYEYSPQEVKIAVTGHGSADKESVSLMVTRLLKLDGRKRLDDELDAIALGVAHQTSFKLKST